MIKLKDLLLERSLSDEMRELKLYIDNDASIYRQRYMPILKNLSRKKKQGKYRKGLASKAFMYLIDDGAKRYVKSYGGNARDDFPKRQRKVLAKDYVEKFEGVFKNQEFRSLFATPLAFGEGRFCTSRKTGSPNVTPTVIPCNQGTLALRVLKK